MPILHLPLKKEAKVLQKLPTGEYSVCHFQNFEKKFANQNTPFMDQFLPKYQCGFQKGFSAQCLLLTIVKK